MAVSDSRTGDTELRARSRAKPRAETAAETREAILDSACRVIAEVGFERIRMHMVGAAAGVSSAALYYHFGTRENLFAEALRYSFENTGADVYGRQGSDDSSTDRLARIISASLPSSHSLTREWSMWMELWCRAARDDESDLLCIELYRKHQGWIEETLREGMASGEFAECDSAGHARLISSLCDGYGVQLMIRAPGLTVNGARQTIWAVAAAPLRIATTFPGSSQE